MMVSKNLWDIFFLWMRNFKIVPLLFRRAMERSPSTILVKWKFSGEVDMSKEAMKDCRSNQLVEEVINFGSVRELNQKWSQRGKAVINLGIGSPDLLGSICDRVALCVALQTIKSTWLSRRHPREFWIKEVAMVRSSMPENCVKLNSAKKSSTDGL